MIDIVFFMVVFFMMSSFMVVAQPRRPAAASLPAAPCVGPCVVTPEVMMVPGSADNTSVMKLTKAQTGTSNSGQRSGVVDPLRRPGPRLQSGRRRRCLQAGPVIIAHGPAWAADREATMKPWEKGEARRCQRFRIIHVSCPHHSGPGGWRFHA